MQSGEPGRPTARATPPADPPGPQVFVKCHFDYDPATDSLIPCKEAGLKFTAGDLLQIVNQDDPNWWQACHVEGGSAGLVPSQLLEEKRKAFVKRDSEVAPTSGALCGSLSGKRKKRMMYLTTKNAEFDRHELLIYEEVARMPPFRRKTLVLIGAQGVGRRSLKNKLIMSDQARYGTTIPCIHYVGQMHEGSMLRVALDQLTDGQLCWQRLPDPYDEVTLGPRRYHLRAGKVAFATALEEQFPAEKAAIKEFMRLSKMVPRWLATFLVRTGLIYCISPVFRMAATSHSEAVAQLTADRDLRALLSYLFYGTAPRDSSFMVNVLMVHHYQRGACRDDVPDNLAMMFITFPAAKDPTYEQRHPGRSCMTILTMARYEWFEEWAGTRAKHRGPDYQQYKLAIAQRLVERALQRFPHLRDKGWGAPWVLGTEWTWRTD
ncbi:maguk p55 subfamily member 2 isoform x2 [Limosa lapponica baueri]|uniref:Maguk p55 subfamily member 2 isoform x2 n=1 Tax=Limosa lapponica baueri TaxID=1758121 RepID=A0A2I0TBZ6_LIMLA|nr:maguk p55 subfamily member 2 isoform x2 [Limosa lapponica baueri]